MKYEVIYDANRQDGNLAVIHKAGCQAAARDETRESWTFNVEGSLRDALDVAVDADDRALGYGDDDVKVHACAS